MAWLSLDPSDNDPASCGRTWSPPYKRRRPESMKGGAVSLLQSPQAPSEAVLATLLNDLDANSTDVVLEVHNGMAFLLQHLPPQVHLVIAERAGSALPLARL